jgi:hypothetical protein
MHLLRPALQYQLALPRTDRVVCAEGFGVMMIVFFIGVCFRVGEPLAWTCSTLGKTCGTLEGVGDDLKTRTGEGTAIKSCSGTVRTGVGCRAIDDALTTRIRQNESASATRRWGFTEETSFPEVLNRVPDVAMR